LPGGTRHQPSRSRRRGLNLTLQGSARVATGRRDAARDRRRARVPREDHCERPARPYATLDFDPSPHMDEGPGRGRDPWPVTRDPGARGRRPAADGPCR
jgi:hypothetical protein